MLISLGVDDVHETMMWHPVFGTERRILYLLKQFVVLSGRAYIIMVVCRTYTLCSKSLYIFLMLLRRFLSERCLYLTSHLVATSHRRIQNLVKLSLIEVSAFERSSCTVFHREPNTNMWGHRSQQSRQGMISVELYRCVIEPSQLCHSSILLANQILSSTSFTLEPSQAVVWNS